VAVLTAYHCLSVLRVVLCKKILSLKTFFLLSWKQHDSQSREPLLSQVHVQQLPYYMYESYQLPEIFASSNPVCILGLDFVPHRSIMPQHLYALSVSDDNFLLCGGGVLHEAKYTQKSVSSQPHG